MGEAVKSSRLRQFNNVLSIVIVALGIYIFATPWLPQANFWWRQKFGAKPSLVIASTNSQPDQPNSDKPTETFPQDNVLVIPKLLLQLKIFEGPGSGTLAQGIWHRPNTSSPNKDGNTVIVGHRFTYSHPNGPFYFLDRLASGDDIIVYWQQQKYVYRVDSVFVTQANDVGIEKASDTSMLTLYTCTPLWSAKDRLIVQAKPIEVSQ